MTKATSTPATDKATAVQDVDGYIAAASPEKRPMLAQLRKIIQAAAPEAEEHISYGMPFYRWHGARVSFAAFKNHVSLFGVSSVIAEHRRELAAYQQTAKGAIHFPLDRPLPAALIEKLVKARMERAAREMK